MEYSKETPLPHPYHGPATGEPARSASKSRPLHSYLRIGTIVALALVVSALAIVTTSVVQKVVTDETVWSNGGSAPLPGVADLGHSYGIAAGGSLTDLTDQQLDQRMAGIAATGARWVRFDFNWNNIQPDNATDYQWTPYDKLVRAAQNHHLFVLGILDYTPPWARAAECQDSDKCHPADPAQFANFARTILSRYKDRGLLYWEIWNEPNNPQFWQPGANPAAYTQLLEQTAKAMRAEDPRVFILTAGLSPQDTTATSYAPIDFLKSVYDAGGKGSFDAVADHPYTFPLSPKDSPDHAWNQMASPQSSLRQTMVAHGDGGKKIWITEYGSPTNGPGPKATITNPNLAAHPYVVDEDLQAKLLSDAIDLYTSYSWVGPFMYYSYQDAGTTTDTNENFFGLVRADGNQKPAYQTFQAAARK